MTERLVETLSKRGCLTVMQDRTIGDLSRFLSKHKIGATPVVDNAHKLVGIVSERDIVRYMAEADDDFRKAPISAIMTQNVITCKITDSASDMMAAMTNKKIRHIPITDEDGVVIGMVSIGDVVNRMIEKYQTETEMMRFYINS